MRKVIPIQRFDQITIECTELNMATNYFNFEIEFNGTTKTKIKLTGETINMINEAVNEIIKKYKKER